MPTKIHFILLLTLIAISSCSVVKKKYSSGYHVEWRKKSLNQKDVSESREIIGDTKMDSQRPILCIPNSDENEMVVNPKSPENVIERNKSGIEIEQKINTDKIKRSHRFHMPQKKVQSTKEHTTDPPKHPLLFNILTGILAVFICITHPFWSILQMVFNKEFYPDLLVSIGFGSVEIYFLIMGIIYGSIVWISVVLILYALNLLWTYQMWDEI